jgi:hypothetical protein
MVEFLSASDASLLLRRPEVLVKGSKMSILELILIAGAILIFFMGYKIGHRDGYIVGRKAVRKFYEQRDQVRA